MVKPLPLICHKTAPQWQKETAKAHLSKQPVPSHVARISWPMTNSIVSTYHSLLQSDLDLTMPVAAIEALVLLLSHSPPSTISETLTLLETATAELKRSVRNPISLSAGTDIFQRYLITSLQRPGQLGPAGDFTAIRNHLLSNGRLFITRAKESRNIIAATAKEFIRNNKCVLTNGGSRVVAAVLLAAASDTLSGSLFRVIYVQSSSQEGAPLITQLRKRGIPVATIPESAIAYAMGKVDIVMVGAEGVVENGGIISRMGTYQIGVLAKSAGKPFYVAVESHKFVRLYPLGQYDLPIEQKVVDFKTDGAAGGSDDVEDAVDFTPPNLITALVTGSGVHTPSAVSEELINIWY